MSQPTLTLDGFSFIHERMGRERDSGPTAFERYAIYWAPEHGSALAEFGTRWFGHASDGGKSTTRAGAQECFGLEERLFRTATATPRRYGLHGTIIAPFLLKPQASTDALRAVLKAFASNRLSVPLGPLSLGVLDGFLALIPITSAHSIQALHTQCLFAFDGFWGEARSRGRQTRSGGAQAPAQRLNVAQWGYAHVLNQFRFHLTLTGPLSNGESGSVAQALEHHLAQIVSQPVTIDALCLYGDPGGGAVFRLIERCSLSGAA